MAADSELFVLNELVPDLRNLLRLEKISVRDIGIELPRAWAGKCARDFPDKGEAKVFEIRDTGHRRCLGKVRWATKFIAARRKGISSVEPTEVAFVPVSEFLKPVLVT